MTLRFDQPWLLLLGLIVVPLAVIGWRSMRAADPLRRAAALGLRALLLLLLVGMLAGPHMRREHRHLTVIGLLDISGSVRRFADLPEPVEGHAQPAATAPTVTRTGLEKLRTWFRLATRTREPDDRFGLIVFDGRAIAVSAPTRGEYNDDNIDTVVAPGTNIADAVRLGLAMFPADTAKRLILVTDGNQTEGDVLEAVRLASGHAKRSVADAEDASAVPPSTRGFQVERRQLAEISPIPIDVLPIVYHVTHDVQVARVEAPAVAQPGQPVTVRIVMEAASPTAGTLVLRREGEEIDLNGSEPGTSRRVTLPQGASVHLAQVTLGQTPINRFQAFFQPERPGDDLLPDNDRAEAFTATPSKGSVLVLDAQAARRGNTLEAMLNAAGLPCETRAPAGLPDDPLSLQNFDLIVLDDVAAAELSTHQQQLLARYVSDLGGGLIMAGGPNGFGAGGWNGTPLEDILPVELDPPKELRLPSAALVFVLDKSGSMNFNVAGARATQQQIANEGAAKAIESLRRDALVGVVTFDNFSHVLVPLQENADPKRIADQVRGISAEGGTNMEPALEQAVAMLRDVKVAKKRVVCLSDGRSMSTENLEGLARQMAAQDIQLTTIAVGDEADVQTLQNMAKVGGGEFHEVRDPRRLPRVFVESVQVINSPLIKEASFTPRVMPSGSTLGAGLESAPPLAGIVITSAREDPKVFMELLHPDGEPLLAHWQAGLGRVAAFTSAVPASDNWARAWRDWPAAATFWTHLCRMMARLPMNPDAELLCDIKDDRLRITFDMSSVDDGGVRTLDYLQVDSAVYGPDGGVTPLRLRQTAPGRYEGEVDAREAGNYIVAVNPRQGARPLAPAIGGANRSSSPEFRRYESNLPLLDEIVELTGGRRLDAADPRRVNLFDREGMPPSVSLLPFWRTLLVWSLLVLLLDVACRRIAWDQRMLRNAASAMVARMAPMSIRGRQAAATLSTLRSASQHAQRRHDEASAGVRKLAGTGVIAPPPPRPVDPAPARASDDAVPVPRAPAAPDPSKVAAALDLLLNRRTADAPDQPSSLGATVPQSGDAASETTGSLLAAKRRARQRMDGGE